VIVWVSERHPKTDAMATKSNRAAGGCRRPEAVLRESDDADVLGFLALSARGNVELDGLALVERAVAAALDVGVVHEDIIAIGAGDEAETLLGVEELDGTCSHLNSSL
jgi:hypothetical protein